MFPPARPADVGLDSGKVARFARGIERWVDDGDVVGAAVAIIKGRRCVLHHVAGWRDRERKLPMERDTIFRIRSMTKPLVGTAAWMLAEDGQLEFDAPVARYLPSFANDRSHGITVRQLTTHTAGYDHPGFPDRIASYGSLAELADAVGAAGPAAEPGRRFCYCDAGPAVLGAVIAEAAGAPVEEVIRTRILEPLAMEDTLCGLTGEDPRRHRISSTYKRKGERFVRYWDSAAPQVLPFFSAAGGMYSTVADYARFLALWMDEGRGPTGRLLASRSVREALLTEPLSRLVESHGYYGMLWYLYSEPDPDDDRVLQAFGHDGSDGTWAMAIPQKDLMVLYFSQSRYGETLWKAMALVRQLIEEKEGAGC